MLISLLTSIFSGGVTGLVGVIVQRFAEYKNRQLDLAANREKMAHEVALRKADAEIMAQEWAARTKVAEVEATGREAVEDSKAFAVALSSEPKRYSEGVKPSRGQGWALVVLDIIRGIVRPALTIYLCALTTFIYLHSRHLLNDKPIGPEQAMELLQLIIGTVLYLTTTCVLFWFGTRNKQEPPRVR